MIKEIVLKRNKLIGTLDKKRIYDKVMSNFPNMTCMFMYFGGSIGYGTFLSGTSDYDVNVSLDGFEGAFKTKIDDIDVFCYGKDVYMERLNPNSGISLYKKCFIDDILTLPDTLIFLNEKYKKEYEAYKNFDLSKVLHGFLSNFYEYFAFCFNDSPIVGKKFYHVVRMRGQLENYKKTGVFSLALDDKYFKEEIDFKLNWAKKERQKEFLSLMEKYLEEIYETKEGLKDG